MMKRVIVGIDPGQKGAIAVFGPDGLDVRDLKPCFVETGTFKSLDPVRLSNLLGMTIPYAPSDVIVYCEESTLHPKNGVMTYRAVFDARGVLRAVCALRGLEVQFVPPATWKRHHKLLRADKAGSVERITEFYPDYENLFVKQYRGREIPLDGRAEAALIALYGIQLEREKNGSKKT